MKKVQIKQTWLPVGKKTWRKGFFSFTIHQIENHQLSMWSQLTLWCRTCCIGNVKRFTLIRQFKGQTSSSNYNLNTFKGRFFYERKKHFNNAASPATTATWSCPTNSAGNTGRNSTRNGFIHVWLILFVQPSKDHLLNESAFKQLFWVSGFFCLEAGCVIQGQSWWC